MSIFENILLATFKDDLDETKSPHFIGNFFRVAKALGNRVTCCASDTPLAEGEPLLRRLGSEIGYTGDLSFQAGTPECDVINRSVDLIVTSLPAARRRAVTLLERARPPILLLPANVPLQDPPFSALLVPMSKESREDQALSLGLRIAHRLSLPVDLIHVTESQEPEIHWQWSFLEEFVDQFHHEYRYMLHDLVTAATPMCTSGERSNVRDIYRAQGPITATISERMGNPPHDLMVAGWNGRLSGTRAATLRELIGNADYPILLVRRQLAGYFRLRTGKNLAA